MKELLHIDPSDNVAVALAPLEAGRRVGELTTLEAIPTGHKVALAAIAPGQPVVKYGHTIGLAATAIAPGAHVHSHNLKSHLDGQLTAEPAAAPGKPTAGEYSQAIGGDKRSFEGFLRHDGRVGVRNEVWIINTVGCVNQLSLNLAMQANMRLVGNAHGVDGVHAFPHPFGCSQLGDDLAQTRSLLASLANHPNAAAVLVLGLGCENNQLKSFIEACGQQPEGRIRYFNTQQVGDELEHGLAEIEQLIAFAEGFERTPMGLDRLVLAMKCGGSDGFSGITANPLVGRVADRVTQAGGTVILSEIPEMFGAEDVLLARACDGAAHGRILETVSAFRGYFRRHGQPIDENPSPGNKEGGITTLAEKSLGCVQKGGRAPVTQVLDYAQPARSGGAGLAIVNAPGNDGVSGTAMTAAGAQLLLFTTGRGTPMGFPAPTLKIASNHELAARKGNWIDFNAGRLLDEGGDLNALADELLSLILEAASGRYEARSERNNCREIAIWKDGVTL